MAGRSTDRSPAYGAVAVTPSDTTVLPTTRGLYVGVTGDLTVTMARDGNDVVFKAAAVGILPIQVTKVKAATAATNILALY